MNLFPDPFHPAVVHFPIVLLLLGAVAAVGAVFWRRNHLPVLAALLLLLGAAGAWTAVESGESDGGLLPEGSPAMEALVDAHETWAKRTLTLSIIAGLAAAGAVLAGRWPRAARAVAVVAAIASAAAAYSVYETGHRGGALVYRHGAGVEVVGTGLVAPERAAATSTSEPVGMKGKSTGSEAD